MLRWNSWSSIFLLFSACSGQPGVVVDIGSWPVGAVSLRVEGTLDGRPSTEPLVLPNGTTRFVIYAQGGERGELKLALTALDENQCTRASATTQVDLGSGLRSILEADVLLTQAASPYCSAPALEGVNPSAGSTAGGITFTLRGQNFLPGAQLLIDGTQASDAVVTSSTVLTATLPKHLGAFGRVPLILQNTDGQSASRSDLFAYYASQFSYSTMTAFPTDQYPQAVAVGDWNDDGAIDIAVATGMSDVSILLGDGTGGFGAPKNINTGPNASAIAVGDFNGDNHPDLAVTAFGSNSVDILLGDGQGSFSAVTNLPNLGDPGAVTVADVNEN